MFYENQSIIIHQILADRIFYLSISLLSWSLVLLGCCSGWFYIGAIKSHKFINEGILIISLCHKTQVRKVSIFVGMVKELTQSIEQIYTKNLFNNNTKKVLPAIHNMHVYNNALCRNFSCYWAVVV